MVHNNGTLNNKATKNVQTDEKPFKDFCESTSAHGFKKLITNGQTVKFIFWHFIICVAFGCLTYHLYTLIDKYLAYNYDETTTLVFDNPVFPDITLCNMDAINADR